MVSVTLLTVLRLSSVTYRVTVRGRAKAGFCALMNVPVARLSGESSHFSTHNDLGNTLSAKLHSEVAMGMPCLKSFVSAVRADSAEQAAALAQPGDPLPAPPPRDSARPRTGTFPARP